MLHEGRGQFVRKGIVGDHVNYFSEDLNKEWDQWISSNLEIIGVTEGRLSTILTFIEADKMVLFFLFLLSA